MKKDSKIFVAGGSGLVGSAILKNLSEKGYTNLITNYHTRPLHATRYTPHAEKLDLLDAQAVKEFFEREKPEFVFLAAAKVGGIVANNTYRADFIYENLQIQNNIIHQSYLNGVKKLMFLGSTCIYPKNAPQPMPEDCLLTDTLEYTNEPYAIAKIAGIKMCESYNLQYGTNFISVMPTNLYGPNDNFDLEKSHVLPALIRKIHLGKALEENNWDTIRKDLNKLPIEGTDGSASNEEIIKILEKYGIKKQFNTQHCPTEMPLGATFNISIEIWGSGSPKREFLYSTDMADACVFLMEKINFDDILKNQFNTQHQTLPSTDGKSCEAVTKPLSLSTITEVRNTHINIGTGIDVSIKELAYMIKDFICFKGELYFNIDKPDGTMKKLTDVSKLHSLGWHHKVELQEGIEKIYQWYKESN
ncbi:GDP-L-fucose synthase family protein [Sulfurovum sp. ST-21]|uniref:GDP-L-fucose synthase n=1 Tax=Sulfurovum indicum TaxID=2779528 RepID=A0A7M1S623_9BACT|nr:GDP-L-fucose synthase [Sulfurovum indicum]QOR62604.1 GDP-L-fucose synthase [Sulfurovum indicum]